MAKKLKKLRKLFIPSSANNYRAKILHLPSLVLIIFIFLLTQTGLSLVRLGQPSVLGYSSNIAPEEIIDLTNQERVSLGLEELKMNADLNEAARRKAADMFAFDYWSHNSPTGRDPWSFFKEVSYDYLYAGENLARDFVSPEAVIAAWMTSPTHKDNLISSHYQEIGVAVVEGELEGLRTALVVQLFGTPVKGVAQQEPQSDDQIYTPAEEESLTPVYQEQTQPINPLTVTKGVAIFILGLLIGVLVVDRLVIVKKNVSRLAGDNLAHISFLLIILLTVFLFRSGSILESITSL